MKLCTIGNFQIIDPTYSVSQNDLIKFLVRVFSIAALAQGEKSNTDEAILFYEKMFARFGCNENSISKRYTFNEDFILPPNEWKVFDPKDPISLGGWEVRRSAFLKFTEEIFDNLYNDKVAPSNIVHVTCTAYESPSPAQLLASRNGWNSTNITQVYHHGCYGSVPAIRVAAGLVASTNQTVDVVHTELHTLHADPIRRTPDQIVGHSLFGDSVVSYNLWPSDKVTTETRAFEILAIHEFIIPETSHLMQWSIVESGMHMVLDKNIPDAIATYIKSFIDDLYSKTEFADLSEFDNSILAIHPGGPRILDKIRDALGLEEERLQLSRKLLYERGNLSSASLPHMWAEILEDETIPTGTLVTSLAFGPGLTAAGVLLKVI